MTSINKESQKENREERFLMKGKPKRIPTPEEYEEDKKIILKSFQEGLPIRRMIARFGYTKGYIVKIRNFLIAEEKISEDEMKLASEKYFEENPNAQGLDKSKVRKSKGNKKAEKRRQKSEQDREQVFELVKQQYIKAQIAKTIGISEGAVRWHINSLIQER